MRELETPFDALVSSHYFNGKSETLLPTMRAAGMRIIGDSGAFSAMSLGQPIKIDDFAAWAERNRQHLAWVASLDAIGDERQSWLNWRYLTRNGLDTVPTVHFGTPPTALDRYADEGADFVGLGGVARRPDRDAVLRWLVSMFRYARDNHPEMRFHGWGVTGNDYLDHLPFYSVDSSGFGASFRYGRGQLIDPRTGKRTNFRLDGRASASLTAALRRDYGASARELADSGAHNRPAHMVLAALNAQHLATYVRARHRVTPPTGQEPIGPRIHVVATSDDFQRLLNHIASTTTTREVTS